ncbi:MAG: (Fe-S)-binding protein, partial [Actinobacteria bacterium]|nr:(Fe-S)-binding protein [Actinomycetota bacterium]
MGLSDFHYEMSHCHRCSYCKFMPYQLMQSQRFAKGCPSIGYRNFYSWCSGGRMALGLSLVEERLTECTEAMARIVFECTMCGHCQVQCRTYN